MVKHVDNWIRLGQSHGPMQVRTYEHSFHTLEIDFVGELPCSANKYHVISTLLTLSPVFRQVTNICKR